MDPFKCYAFDYSICHETDFTRSQTQGYYRLINNIHSVGKLLSYYKIELKRVPRHTAQIYEPTQGGKASLGFVVIRFE